MNTCPVCSKPVATELHKVGPKRRYHYPCYMTALRARKRERYRSGGSRHGNTNLTEADVIAIREAHANGARICDLARKYNMTSGGMCAILARRTWMHV